MPEGVVAFVYRIVNLKNDRIYLGKKRCQFVRTKQVKGKRKRFKVDSDWKTYFGSSVELLEDVEKLGEDNFRREIIRFCTSLSEASYYEAKYQFETDALLHPDRYYNSWVFCRVRRTQLKHLVDTSTD